MNASNTPGGQLNAAHIAGQAEQIVRELIRAGNIRSGQIVVFGVSTSEVIGRHIGTFGTEEVAAAIFDGIRKVREETGFYPAFQCCEHLNRAVVVERELIGKFGLEEVAVIPVAKAGGSMAAYAYRKLEEASVVEFIAAHAGVDIGDTLIGMHLGKVAVPFRPSVRAVGQAHVNAAFTRPKLIGGERAVYRMETESNTDHCR